jgi:plasmid stabilization system protein ParE
MVADIRWLEEANDDIRSILTYISSDNAKAAKNYVDAIGKSCEKLSQFPESGRVYNERYRFWLSGIILYSIDMTQAETRSPLRECSMADGTLKPSSAGKSKLTENRRR